MDGGAALPPSPQPPWSLLGCSPEACSSIVLECWPHTMETSPTCQGHSVFFSKELFEPKARKKSGKFVWPPQGCPPPACWPAVFLALEQFIPPSIVMVSEKPPALGRSW